MTLTINISALTQLEAFTLALGRLVQPGDRFFLHGNLGAGKTALVKSFFFAIGFQGIVKSPTYTLVESYEHEGQQYHHFDLYRMKTPLEFYESGLDDYFDQSAIIFIEWPEKGERVLPESMLSLHLSYDAEQDERQVKCVANNPRGVKMIEQIRLLYQDAG